MIADSRNRRPIAGALASVTLVALAGCSVRTNVDATGAAPAAATHVAVTVTQVWFATSADTLPDDTTGWVRHTLATPLTMDLATLTSGTLLALATQLNVASGSYRQVHLVLSDATDAITTSAQGAGLVYNAQYSFTDSGGVLSNNALELPTPGGGITIPVSLAIDGKVSLGSGASSSTSSSSSTGATSATSTSTGTLGSSTSSPTTISVAVGVDAARDVLSYSYGTSTGYILSPVMTGLDESLAGGISGTVDLSSLASGHAPVWASAETTDPSGTHHVVMARRLVGTDGSFTLYPLPASKSGSTDYDLVISCAGADTVIVSGIPVSAGAVSAATSVQSTAIPLAAATTVYADVNANNPVLPGGARVSFYQTASAASALPYLIDGTAVDPVTRRLPGDAFALSAGAVAVGRYASGGAVSFTTAAPLQGDGGYVVGSEGLYRADTLATASTLIGGTSSAPTEVLVPLPVVASNGKTGTLTVTLSAPSGAYDSGFLVVSGGNRVVEAANVGPILATGGGNVAIPLPAGSALVSGNGVPYQVALRAWNSTNPTTTLVRVAGPNSVSLGDSGAATLSLPVP